MPGGSEWILILLVVLLFFGGKKIPDLMKGIGRGVREFNDAKTNVKDQIEAGMTEKDIKETQAETELREAREKLAQAELKLTQAQQAQQMQTELPK
ncbi:MAG: twin-arginine translocase TatA/TatE family subunit [Chitinophagaceae bacterium]|nr:twin-arginine translocase TatA/TatE family subunit [Chitinophagaceae bacterium]